MKEIISGLVRHLLTTAGGALGAKGLADSEEIATGVGAAVTLIGVIWSIVAKARAKKTHQPQGAGEVPAQVPQLPSAANREPIRRALPLLFVFFVPFVVSSGCAHFSTTQTDTSYEHGQISRSITTEASATTVAASKTALAQWKASQTDKTQGASVGSLTQESDAEKLLRAAIDQAVKSAAPIP